VQPFGHPACRALARRDMPDIFGHPACRALARRDMPDIS
jgi:hypothetical protein